MKKTIKQALIFSLIIHVLLLVGTIGYGYIKTIYYVPDVVNAYEEVYYLQNEVAFGVCFQSMSMTLNLNNFANIFVSLRSNYITTKA